MEMAREVYGLKMVQMKVPPFKLPTPKYFNMSLFLPSQPYFQDLLQD